MPCRVSDLALTLQGAADLCAALRAMREARDVLVLELWRDAEDDAAVLALRCAIRQLERIYREAVPPARDALVRLRLGLGAVDG